MFLLKRRRPEKYCDRPHTLLSQPQPTRFNVSNVKFNELSAEAFDVVERISKDS